MSLAKALRPKVGSVMGIDASTNSIAFCIFRDGKLARYGEIDFNGSDVFERTLDAKLKVSALNEEFSVDFVAIESAVMVRSAAVAIKMAYVFGAIIAELQNQGARVVAVSPLEWQTYIGNSRYSRAEKAAVSKANPNRSASWVRNHIREARKQRTMDFFNEKFGVVLESDNVGDAFGLAWFASHKLTESG
jgi:Holliday junction resolvasome RuvABC endonuclease subunit